MASHINTDAENPNEGSNREQAPTGVEVREVGAGDFPWYRAFVRAPCECLRMREAHHGLGAKIAFAFCRRCMKRAPSMSRKGTRRATKRSMRPQMSSTGSRKRCALSVNGWMNPSSFTY